MSLPPAIPDIHGFIESFLSIGISLIESFLSIEVPADRWPSAGAIPAMKAKAPAARQVFPRRLLHFKTISA